MDSLLAGNLILPWEASLAGDVVQRRSSLIEFRIDGERYSGIQEKVFGFVPESLFTFIPESRSESPRNGVRLYPGTAFTLARNTHFASTS
jgi:hypothetical protein